jgi:hypothetical protein
MLVFNCWVNPQCGAVAPVRRQLMIYLINFQQSVSDVIAKLIEKLRINANQVLTEVNI